MRELGHFAERCALGFHEAPRTPAESGEGGLAERVDRFERRLIQEELLAAGGDVRAAAEALGLPRKTLYDKLTRHGLTASDYR